MNRYLGLSRFNVDAACKQLLRWTNISPFFTRARTGTCAGSSFGVESPHASLSSLFKQTKRPRPTRQSSIGRVMGPMGLSSNRHRARLLLIHHLSACSLLRPGHKECTCTCACAITCGSACSMLLQQNQTPAAAPS